MHLKKKKKTVFFTVSGSPDAVCCCSCCPEAHRAAQQNKTKQKEKKKKILADVNHSLKSENRDYLAEVCGGEVGERAVEQRHDTDMAVTRSCSLCVSLAKQTHKK